MKLGIWVNVKKEKSAPVVAQLTSWLRDNGWEYLLCDQASPLVSSKEPVCPKEELGRRTEMIIALGGDGTLLAAARVVGCLGTPILGVNLGRLGFLTELRPEGLFSALERIRRKQYSIEERMVLQVTVKTREDQPTFFALNEVVLDKGGFSRVIELKMFIDGTFVGAYAADGLIISTPTGSTAHSLSAGGPIVNPRMRAIIATPLCPHTLAIRPMILCHEETLEVEVSSDRDSAMVTVDGQVGYELRSQDRIAVKKADHTVKLVQAIDKSFYEVLRTKLKWGVKPTFG